MPVITDKPDGLKSSNDLDDIEVDDDETPPAYLTFGHSPAPMENPPEIGETRTYIVRARCTGIHGPIERKDGEMRYTRALSIQAVWEPGQKPPVLDDDQGELFDRNGNPTDDEDDDDSGARAT